MLRRLAIVMVLGGGILVACAGSEPPPKELPGVHNLQQVMPGLLSGSSPEGDAGFTTLKKLGIKTIISVDGGKPDVERARNAGMRYVHLPIGYNGVPVEQGLRIARAVRDLPGPIFIHCHHGKHRGPAAAAVAMLCIDKSCTVVTAIDFMKHAGTDARYTGLYDAAKQLQRPSKAELDKVSAEFPEIAKVTGLAQAMVEIDEHWEAVKLFKKAGWVVPREHPDIDPPHEAAILARHYLDAAKGEAKREELRTWLTTAHSNARELAKLLQQRKGGAKVELALLEALYTRMTMNCTRCHQKYRDTPQ